MKLTLITAGSLMILAGVLGDQLGLSSGSGFGFGQVFMCLTGIVLAAAGFFGKKFPSVYRDVSLILLNTLILLLFIEFAAIMAVKLLGVETISPGSVRESIQREQLRETGVFFPERRFKPFLVWRSVPTQLSQLDIDSSGVRRTLHAPDDAYEMSVMTLGGSAMWGWMVPDSLTIASLLQQKLNATVGPDLARVENLAENGYTSTQEVIQLLLSLQSGDRPSVVIFYDGFNDVLASCENAAAGTVIGQSVLEDRFSSSGDGGSAKNPPSLLEFLSGTTTIRLIRSAMAGGETAETGPDRLVISHPSLRRENADLKTLAEETASIYLANYDLVSALSDDMDFEYYFVLQPYLHRNAKSLTPSEEEILAGEDSVILELASLVYEEIKLNSVDRPRIIPADMLFETEDGTLFTDVCHTTPQGNRIVASFLADMITEDSSPQ